MLALRMDYPLALFALTAAVKGGVELWVSRQCHRGGPETSQGLSLVFLILGLVTPLLILTEILFTRPVLPLLVCVVFALVEVALLALRMHAVRTLGPYYSVHIRIIEGQKLVQSGIYRHLRHPLYLIALLEAVAYPLAAGAYRTMVLLVLLQAPAILWRRRQEEGRLRETFGQEYEAYRKKTWF